MSVLKKKSEPKSINADQSESERIIVNASSSGKSESKSINISVNTSIVNDDGNETKDEEPSVTDNSVINTPSYFKLLECGKTY